MAVKKSGSNGNRSSIRLASSLKSRVHRRELRQLAQGWELVSDAVSVTNPETNRLWYINPAWRQLYGYTFTQALNKPAEMLNPRDFSDKVQRSILIQTRKGKWSDRLLNKNSTNQVFPVDLRSSLPIPPPTPGVLGRLKRVITGIAPITLNSFPALAG